MSKCAEAMWCNGMPAGVCGNVTFQGDARCPGHGGQLPVGLRTALDYHFGAATLCWFDGFWRVTKCFDGIHIVQADFRSGWYKTDDANVPGWSDTVNAATNICKRFEKGETSDSDK